MTIESIISRFSEEDVQDIMGKDTIQLISNIDEGSNSISGLKDAILKVYSPTELLFRKDTSVIIIDVLRKDEVDSLLLILTGKKSNDPYATLKGINFNSASSKSKVLAFFDIEWVKETVSIELLSAELVKPDYPLFKHQIDAADRVVNKLNSGNRRCLLHMPTGSGKTRTAMNVICEVLRKKATVILWFANTEELCEQAFEEFNKAWKNLGNRSTTSYRFWGNNSISLDEISDGFIVCGLAKSYSLLKSDHNEIIRLSSKVSLIVMDEAHMAIAKTYKQLLDLINLGNQKSSILGLSATPGRTWNTPEADLELSDFFGKSKVTLKIPGYPNPVDYLVNEGYLARINNSTVLNKSGIDVSKADMDYLRDNLKLPDSILKRLSKDGLRNLRIVNRIKDLTIKHTRIIVFALNVDHSNTMAFGLQSLDINAFSITSKTDGNSRKKLIEMFKSDHKETMVLCNYGILSTGFDAPKVSCAVITRPTDSLVLYSQMVGRAIRGKKAGGNYEADIVTVVDTCLPGFNNVSDAFFNWEDVWE